MKVKQNIYILVIIIIFIDSFKCLKDDSISYDVLKYLKVISYTLNKAEGDKKDIYIRMDVDRIYSNDCLLNLYQTDPQNVRLEYKFEKENEISDFTYLNNWIALNDGEKHTLCYEIEKPKGKGYTLYLKITVSNFKDKQEFSVQSTDHQFNYYLLVILIVTFSALIVFVIIFLTFYCMFKSKSGADDINDFDIVFAKVGPEDL